MQILRKGYPDSVIKIENAKTNEGTIFIYIDDEEPAGKGSCLYDFAKGIVFGAEREWEGLLKNVYEESLGNFEKVHDFREQVDKDFDEFINGNCSEITREIDEEKHKARMEIDEEYFKTFCDEGPIVHNQTLWEEVDEERERFKSGESLDMDIARAEAEGMKLRQ
jgi:hypothetical protein